MFKNNTACFTKQNGDATFQAVSRKAWRTEEAVTSRSKPQRSHFVVCVGLALLIFAFCPKVFAAPPTLAAQPTLIQPGQSCVLTWTSDGGHAYLLNYGLVNPNGSLKIKPSHSTCYTLVVETKAGVEAATANVDMEGQRGGIQLPGRDEFKFSATGQEKSLDYAKFLAVVEDVIRTNHFEPIGTFLPSESYVVYYTDRVERNELRGKDEQGRSVNRLTYSVEIDYPTADDPREVKFNVKALVEFRPVAESDWYPSEDPDLSTMCAENLRDQILVMAQHAAQ